MNTEPDDLDIDYNRMIVKPLYFGLFTNILIPMGLLLVCYYLNDKQSLSNQVGDFAETLFIIFGVLSVGTAVFALWWRMKRFAEPLIRRKETFEADLGAGLMKISRPVFMIIAAITLYGVIYFFLTARFQETVFMVFFSFIVFQVVRPRHGQIKSLITRQRRLVDEGRFLS
jgi:small-conductance mechanosensitive channel